MSVHRFLVTISDEDRMRMWIRTTAYANWIEGRLNRHGSQTWMVTVFDTEGDDFLAVARAIGATVEEIEDAGDDERYLLRVGNPGTGWADQPQGA